MLLKVGGILANERNDQNDIFWSSLINTFSSMVGRTANNADDSKEEQSFSFESVIDIGKMLLGQQENREILLGLLPMIMDAFNNGGESTGFLKKHDHSGHSWFLPPILENLHVMWDHFRYLYVVISLHLLFVSKTILTNVWDDHQLFAVIPS